MVTKPPAPAMPEVAIELRPTAEERDLLERAATVLGKSRSDFVLETACDRACDVLLDGVSFAPDAGSFQRSLDLLDAAAAPNPGLDRLLAVRAPWD